MKEHNLNDRITEMHALLKLLALAKGIHVIEAAGNGRLRPGAGKKRKKGSSQPT